VSVTLHEHPFAAYCWKALIALYEREVPFERVFVGDRTDHLKLWPLGSIPVLVDGDLVLPESTAIVEYLDRFGDRPPMIPQEPDAALQVRLWDRLIDGHVMTPMQKIVLDALRPEGREDPEGVEQARAELLLPG
jgi:glutathione S-transferase